MKKVMQKPTAVPSQSQGQLPKDNALDGIVRGLTQLLMGMSNPAIRKVITKSTSESFLEGRLFKYFEGLDEVPVKYTRSQMIVDMIALLKSGNSGIAVHLSNLLGFESIAKEADITYVNFSDIPQEFLDKMEV